MLGENIMSKRAVSSTMILGLVVWCLAPACAPSVAPEVAKAEAVLQEAWAAGGGNVPTIIAEAVHYPDSGEARQKVDEALSSGSKARQSAAVKTALDWEDEDLLEKVEALIGSGAPTVQLAAARGLARQGRDAGRDMLLERLRDPDGRLSMEDCGALYALGESTVVEQAIADLRSKDEGTVEAALYCLAETGGDAARRALLGALENLHGAKRSPALLALSEVGGEEDFAAIVKYAKYRENVVAVLDALGNIGGDHAKRELRSYLSSKDPVARLVAVRSLIRLGAIDEALLRVVEEAVASDSKETRYSAALAMSETQDESQLGGFLRRLAGDDDPHVRKEALGALFDLASDVDAATLKTAWEKGAEADSGPSYQATILALRLAARSSDPAVQEVLDAGMNSEHWGHAIAAAWATLSRNRPSTPESA